ncbi:MAG TPA: hypothetical protein VK737_01815, partial [Opitutales bacterium]|nr:hypothetical protein [Opitutales bacterium]
KMAPGLQRDSVLSAIIGSWADQDPKGFLSETKGITGPRMRETGVDAALKAWSAQNPTDAMQWIKDNPGGAPGSAMQARYLAAFSGYADNDPQAAFAAANALDGSNNANQRLKNQAVQAVMSSMADQGNFTGATAMIGQMADGNMKNQALSNIANSWAASNPADASAWVSSMTDPQQQATLGAQVAAQWASTDPAAAATWAAQMDAQASAAAQANGGTSNSYLLADAMRTWASYDLDGTGDFLNQLPASPDKDGAVATFALYAAQDDPASAMNWVNTISDPQMQQRLAIVTALEWQQADPDGYNQFISTTSVLSPQQIQALNNIPPIVGTFLSGGLGGAGGGFGGGGGGGNNVQANAGGIPPRLQNFIISGGAGANGGMANLLLNGGFGGGGAANPGGSAQPGGTNTGPTGVQIGPNIITNLRQRRGGGGGGNGG